MKKYLPISFYVFASLFYDIWSSNPIIEVVEYTPANVNWTIFYISTIYVSWLIHCVVEAVSSDKWFFGLMGLSIVVRLGMELRCVGMTYKQYISKVTDIDTFLIPLCWVLITSTMIIIYYANRTKGNS